MNFLTKIREKFEESGGQHTIEYAVLLILIMAGIMIMGPYVIRSWNANLKGWEDSVYDSLTDPLLESPPSEVTLPGCDLDPIWVDDFCGAGITDPCSPLPLFQCGQFEVLMTRTYSPPGCQCSPEIIGGTPTSNYLKCEARPGCCAPWTPTTPIPINDCGPNATPPCPDGEMRQFRACGTGVTETRCKTHFLCAIGCQGGLPVPAGPEYLGICPGDDVGVTGQNYRFVAGCPDGYVMQNLGNSNCAANECYQGGCSTNECLKSTCSQPDASDPKCQVMCNTADGYIPLGGGVDCGCPPDILLGVQTIGSGAYNGSEQVAEHDAIKGKMQSNGIYQSSGVTSCSRDSLAHFVVNNGGYFELVLSGSTYNLGPSITIVHRQDWAEVRSGRCNGTCNSVDPACTGWIPFYRPVNATLKIWKKTPGCPL